MMRLIVDWFTCLIVVIINVRNVLTLHHIEKCTLLPSELGPDWYKVPRPVPPGIDGKPAYEPSYIHMPCAKTTVFDVGVCGCTSLMSFIFTSVSRRKQIHHEIKGGKKVDPDDFIKQIDESSTQRPPAGSLLINTRTGEVKECPFRASSRGPQWYLIREPQDKWRHMICADGTVFEKRRCTCVHQLLEIREPDKPEDANIVIIEEDWVPGGKTISQSLGISVEDVDFSGHRRSQDVPFWRRQDLFGSRRKEERRSFHGKSDVKVTLHNHELENNTLNESVNRLDIGQDQISEAHKDLFFKGTRGHTSHTRAKISPLGLDTKLQNDFDLHNRVHPDRKTESLLIPAKKIDSQKKQKVVDTNEILNVLDQISTQIDVLTKAKENATIVGVKSERKITEASNADGHDEKFFEKLVECAKKPLPELGPQYFLLDVMNFGHTPFTCHGNAIYNHTLCACIPSTGDAMFDEVTFPFKECAKRPFPELGPQYFLDHLHGVGYIPYVCHGNMIYDENMCACV